MVMVEFAAKRCVKTNMRHQRATMATMAIVPKNRTHSLKKCF